MTTLPRPVLLLLAATVALAVPMGWLVGDYLESFGVPLSARVGIGLLMVPAMFALTLVAFSTVSGLHDRRQRSKAELQAVSGDELDRREAKQLFERMQELDRSSLVRVLGIGRAIESDGITVEFLALELRGGGGSITLRAHGRGLASARGMVRWPRMAITDDVETKYVIGPGEGGGGEDSMQYELRFIPAPPAGARTLDVAVVDFASTAWPFDRTDERQAVPDSAPWHVAIDLR